MLRQDLGPHSVNVVVGFEARWDHILLTYVAGRLMPTFCKHDLFYIYVANNFDSFIDMLLKDVDDPCMFQTSWLGNRITYCCTNSPIVDFFQMLRMAGGFVLLRGR